MTQLLTGLSGVVLPFAGPTAPPGWLLCDGSSLLRADYKPLFAVIGTTYGSADGTHFNLPDLRGRVPSGVDNMGGTQANRLVATMTGNVSLGSASITSISSTANLAVGMSVFGNGIPAGATITVVNSATAITISANATAAGTGVSLRFSYIDANTVGASGGSQAHKLTTAQMPSHSHVINASINSNRVTQSGGSEGILSQLATTNTNNTGSDQVHPNIQPTIILNYIIKT